MSLRDEIAAIPHYPPDMYRDAVLAIVDRHETDRVLSHAALIHRIETLEKQLAEAIRLPIEKPSDEWPARHALQGRYDRTHGSASMEALAIVEAIDSSTETRREWVDLLRKQSRIVESLVAAAKSGEVR